MRTIIVYIVLEWLWDIVSYHVESTLIWNEARRKMFGYQRKKVTTVMQVIMQNGDYTPAPALPGQLLKAGFMIHIKATITTMRTVLLLK